MNDFLDDFPLLSRYTYLNTAYTGLLPAPTFHWRREADNKYFTQGSLFRSGHKELFTQLRAESAQFFGTEPGNLALLPNFSFGFNVLLDGIPAGQKVLLLREDYPSVNWAAESRDFQTFYASIDERVEDNILLAVERHRPDVLAFSPVHFISGIQIDERFLHQLKDKFPQMLLLADGTQYLGTVDFNFDQSPFDAIGSSGYKWLLSGFGNGVLMVKPEAQERISPGAIGFNSADAVDGDRDSIPFFGKFEPGHQDTLVFGSMLQSLRYLKGLGMKSVTERIRDLIDYAYRQLAEFDLVDRALMDRPVTSPIIQIRTSIQDASEFLSEGVICSKRGEGLRLSFHFYNRMEDIDRLIRVLRKLM